jgi:hypothetical protein
MLIASKSLLEGPSLAKVSRRCSYSNFYFVFPTSDTSDSGMCAFDDWDRKKIVNSKREI